MSASAGCDAGERSNHAILLSVFGEDDEEMIGATIVLDRLGAELPDTEGLSRDYVLTTWLSAESSSDRRNAAVDYLANNGGAEDLHYVELEYERSDSSTSRRALECIRRPPIFSSSWN